MKPQTIKRFLVMSILFNSIFIGALFNQEALLKNGGKMPVLSDYQYSTSTHFSYQDKDDVELWYFTDWIKWERYIWSLGDFMMVISITWLFIFAIYSIIQGVKEWREKLKKSAES